MPEAPDTGVPDVDGTLVETDHRHALARVAVRCRGFSARGLRGAGASAVDSPAELREYRDETRLAGASRRTGS